MIAIIDYGSGNLASVFNMLKKLNIAATITNEPSVIGAADKIILPGVGAFDTGMQNLQKFGLIDILHQKVLVGKVPFLGICLGMQLACLKSEEGQENGLGWIDAEVKKFPSAIAGDKLKVPHIGWTDVIPCKKNTTLFHENENNRFYFVHSYYVSPTSESDILTQSKYGISFCSSFSKDNIIGVQFHPEKSHKYGMNLLTRFASL